MKTRIFGGWGMALVVMVVLGLSFVAGSLQGTDSSDANGPVAPASPTVAQNDATAPLPAPVPDIVLSPGTAEIVKLAQSGLSQSVMQAYIANTRSKFNLGSDQIVYLSDLGVSSDVVKSMIERDASLDAAAQATLANSNPPPAPMPDTTSVNPPPMDTADTAYPPVDMSTDTTVNDADYFYNSLSPYGNWAYISGYGYCWQPTLCRSNPEWRPYCDQGRWLDSDCGWYWQSDYSWGWAAFHYGRWFHAGNRGWLWAPDRTWGPAWVSWRHSTDYAGWAPLPPHARFIPTVGLAIGGHAVRSNFEFGLNASHYTFIPLARLSDYTPARYAVPSWKSGEVFSQTAVANHFATENNHAVNHSIDPREVVAQAGTPIRHVEVRDTLRAENNLGPSDHLSRHGGASVIYRPQLPAPTATRATGSIAPRQNLTPSRTYNTLPRVSSEPTHYTAPLYLSGSSPTYPRETSYPTGSLVVIGSHNNTVASRLGGPSYRVYDSAIPGLTHEVPQPAQGEAAYVIPSHSGARSENFTHNFNPASRGDFPHDGRFDARGPTAVDSRGDFHGNSWGDHHSDSHSDFHAESHAQSHSDSSPAVAHSSSGNYSSGGGGSHASSSAPASSSSSSSGSSSSGHH